MGKLSLILSLAVLVGLVVPSVTSVALNGARLTHPDQANLWAGPMPAVNDVSPNVYAPITMKDVVAPRGMTPPGPSRPFIEAKEAGTSAELLRTLVETLGQASEVSPPLLMRLTMGYYARLGFDVPFLPLPSQATTLDEFDENETLTFTYPLGDVNGDGFEDVALNVYCVTLACRYGWSGSSSCGAVPQRVYALSGSGGNVVWEYEPAQLAGNCFMTFVVGTIPMPDAPDALLTYSVRYNNGFPGLSIEHAFRLVSGADGTEIWGWNETGSLLTVCVPLYCTQRAPRVVLAENLLVNPLLQVPAPQGVEIVARTTTPALFLQGVGATYSYVQTPLSLPGHTGYPLIESYQPQEWAARLNLSTGDEMWRANTFQRAPAGERSSLLPILFHDVPPLGLTFPCTSGYYSYDRYAPMGGCDLGYSTPVGDPRYYLRPQGFVGSSLSWYWRNPPCCFDVTGDGVPDLVYTTLEWSATPSTNDEGPYDLSSRLVLFDGATGGQVYSVYLVENAPRFIDPEWGRMDWMAYYAWPDAIGDVNADGSPDLVVNEIHLGEAYRRTVSVRSGSDGSILWKLERPKALAHIVLGDANQDGAQDLLALEWFSWEYPSYGAYGITNVTRTRLTVLSGTDGTTIWSTETFQAPIDVYLVFLVSLRRNGLMDVNGDGVGDVLVEDPLQLGDLTLVRRHVFLSGTDGRSLGAFSTLGAFFLPVFAGDVNGDGVDDFLALHGDVMDIWITQYSGGTLEALWSNRFLKLRQADYTLAIPKLASHALGTPFGSMPLVNFQLEIGSYAWGQTLSVSRYPQLSTFWANGTVNWAYPHYWDDMTQSSMWGPSPAVASFERTLEDAGESHGPLEAALEVAAANVGYGAWVLAMSGASMTLGFLYWRRKP